MPRPRVIAIRAGHRKMMSRIFRCLGDRGVDHIEVDAARDVPAALHEDGADAVLVFTAQTGTHAQELLGLLRHGWADVPVIVVVEQSSFDEYYDLMCEGAYDYYELSEGAEVIAEALRWATHTDATPPRARSLETDRSLSCVTADAA